MSSFVIDYKAHGKELNYYVYRVRLGFLKDWHPCFISESRKKCEKYIEETTFAESFEGRTQHDYDLELKERQAEEAEKEFSRLMHAMRKKGYLYDYNRLLFFHRETRDVVFLHMAAKFIEKKWYL